LDAAEEVHDFLLGVVSGAASKHSETIEMVSVRSCVAVPNLKVGGE
jgi:hypothetical protein